MSITKIIKNKKVLFIPVYSARSYETGLYNLNLDGNMARVTSKLLSSDFLEADVLIPENLVDDYSWQAKLRNKNVYFLECNAYGKNAYDTRTNHQKFLTFLETIQSDEYDYIIVEPNTLALELSRIKELRGKLIYWCVASKTSKGTPWFVEEFALIDKLIAENIKTECVLESQVEYLGGKSYSSFDFYNAEIFDYKTILFPFRLSDKNYHALEFRNSIEKLKTDVNYKVLYTDVNDSGIFKDNEVFRKVSGQKESYIEMLKAKPIIPYLENSQILTHINIYEFMYYNCDIIMFYNKDYEGFKNVTFIESISELTDVLKRRIENGK